MLIVCPACASEYEIPTDRVGEAGRSVRCAACRETWFITPDDVAAATLAQEPVEEAASAGVSLDADADEQATIVDEPMPYARRPAAKVKPKRAMPGMTALRSLSPALMIGLALFVILPLGLLGRSTVVRAMPQTAGLFAKIGLPVNLRGIDLRDVVAFQNPAEAGKPGELVVEGDLVGAGRERVAVPDIAVEVRDAHDQVLYRWTVPAPRATLESAETARFRASLSAPPLKGRAVQVRFADGGSSESGPAEASAHGAESHDAEPAAARAEAASPKAAADPHHAPAHGH